MRGDLFPCQCKRKWMVGEKRGVPFADQPLTVPSTKKGGDVRRGEKPREGGKTELGEQGGSRKGYAQPEGKLRKADPNQDRPAKNWEGKKINFVKLKTGQASAA